MRNPSRAILLAVLMASLILPPVVPVAGATTVDPTARKAAASVLLVGDSLSIDLGQQLETVFAGRPGVRFAHLGKVSSGLATPSFFDWNAHLTAQVKAHHPDVVFIMVGANDNKNLPTGHGRHAAFGTPAWDQAYAARLTRLYDIIRADNSRAKVFFLGVPVMADAAFDAETVRINAVLADTAKRLPDSAFVRTRDVLADANGGFAAQGKTPDGRLVRLRARDGVHVTTAGSQLLAARCLAALSGLIDQPRTALLAALPDRDIRPVGTAAALAEATPAPAVKPAATPVSAPAAAAPKPVVTVVAAAKTAPAPVAKPAPAPAVQPAAAAAAYTVADGDTLWSVAHRLGVSPDRLAEANPGVDPRHLSIGQSLAVPAGGQAVQVAARTDAPAAYRTYTVADGDNLWGVARHYDVTVGALTEANPGIDPVRLRIGQQLRVPATGGHQPAQVAATPTTAAYTVADGDNFWSIAHRLGVDVAELRRANAGLDPLRLHPGQVLSLPGNARADAAQPQARTASRDAGDTGLYPVAKGDTLWSLARRFGVSLDVLLAVNGEIDPSHLQVGQLVTIPAGGQPVASAETLLFPVSSGDTLWGIARRFDLTVEALTAANPGVDPLHLRAGQKLHVPSSLAAVAAPSHEAEAASGPVAADTTSQLHSVVSGDTLWNLARHYGISLDRILELNAGIDPARLQVGQTVWLPVSQVSMAAR